MITTMIHGWRIKAAMLITFLLAVVYSIAGVAGAPQAHAYSGYNIINECWGTNHSVNLYSIYGVWGNAACASWVVNKYEAQLQYNGYVNLCNTAGGACVRYWAGGPYGLTLHYDHIVYTVS